MKLKSFIVGILSSICILINNDIEGQWIRIQDFDFYCNTATLSYSNMIWGVGSNGWLFNYDLNYKQFQYHKFNEDFDILSLSVIDSSTIYLGGRNYDEENGFTLLYDFNQDSVIFVRNHNNEIWDIEFINRDTGIIVGFEGIQVSKDGGHTWNLLWEFSSIGAEFGELYSIISTKPGVLYACGRKLHYVGGTNHQGFVLKSIDYGNSWSVVLEIPESYLVNLEFKHDVVYCHDKETNTIFTSNDYGESWSPVEIPISNPLIRINDVTLLSGSHILACISQNIFFAEDGLDHTVDMLVDSPDGGKNWFIQFENYPTYPPRDTLLNTLVNINDSTIYSFGWNLALMTENSGGNNNPGLSVSSSIDYPKLVLYPNPATNSLFLYNRHSSEDLYIIQNLSGEIVRIVSLIPDELQTIPIDYLDPGAYIISLITGTKITLSTLFIKI